jgi:hypothetical protein
MTVAADEARNEGGAPKYVGHGADVEAGRDCAGRISASARNIYHIYIIYNI